MQFPAVLRGLLALFSHFLIDILSHIQFLTHVPHYFYAHSDKLRHPYLQKVGVRAPQIPRGSTSAVISGGYFLADRTNGRAIGTVLRLSSSVVVCDVMYCG